MGGLTFKTTANAFAWRRLVTVSKRGGMSGAAVLPAGEYYLTNSRYPPDHWARRRRRHRADPAGSDVLQGGLSPGGAARQQAHADREVGAGAVVP